MQNKKFLTVRRGQTAGKLFKFGLENGEFITKIQYGCDFHGIYFLMLESSKKTLVVGDLTRPRKEICFGEGKGLVGVFGAHSDIILHLGFYFDIIQEVNWKRHREIMLIRKKGKVTNDNDLVFLLKINDQLLRYLAGFV